jgi:hypothetical protein
MSGKSIKETSTQNAFPESMIGMSSGGASKLEKNYPRNGPRDGTGIDWNRSGYLAESLLFCWRGKQDSKILM